MLPGGESRPVTINGSLQLPAVPGWRPIHAVSCAGSIVLLAWANEEGDRGTWYLDPDMVFIGNIYANLAPELRKSAENAVTNAFGQAWDQLLCNPEPRIPLGCRALTKIDGNILKETLFKPDIVLPELSSELRDLHDVDPDRSFVANMAGLRVRLECRYLQALLDYRFEARNTFPDDMASALKTGRFAWPSPVDGRTLESAHCIPLSDGIIAYRVCDRKYGLVFYVVCAWGHKAFVYIPAARQLYFVTGKVKLLADHFNAQIEQLFVQSVAYYGEQLGDYFKAPITGFSLISRVGHIGHHLWNELTEISELVGHDIPNFSSDVIVMHGSRAEPLGKIEEIFPVLTGRVIRDVLTHAELVRYCFANGRCIIEPTTSYITRKLADRVVDINIAHPDLQQDFAGLARYAAEGWQILLIGLRIENRTDTDLGDFCVCVVQAALQVVDQLVVVIDCLNAEFYGADAAFLAAQAAVAEHLLAHFPFGGRVQIIDLAGAPVRRSLFWSRHARCVTAQPAWS
jgi:hypothetical protein